MILRLKRIRLSCKYIRVHCGLSSSVAGVASISVLFRNDERGTTVKDRAKNGTLFHFLALISFPTWPKPENPIPQSFFAVKPNGSSCYAG